MDMHRAYQRANGFEHPGITFPNVAGQRTSLAFANLGELAVIPPYLEQNSVRLRSCC
jgi:hypothetical protein